MSNDFVKNVKVERELVNSINSFQHLSADWALNLVISEEVRQTRSAESVAAAHNDSGDSCTNIVLKPTKVAIVQSPCAVVRLELAYNLIRHFQVPNYN